MAQRAASFAKGFFTAASRRLDTVMQEKILKDREKREEERKKAAEERDEKRKKALRKIEQLATLGVTLEDIFPQTRQPPAELGGGPPTPAIDPTTGERRLALEIPEGGGPLTKFQAGEERRAAEEADVRALDLFEAQRDIEIEKPLPQRGQELEQIKVQLQIAKFTGEASEQALEEWTHLSDEEKENNPVDQFVNRRVREKLAAAGLEVPESFAEPQPSEIVEQSYIDAINKALTAGDARADVEALAAAPGAPPLTGRVGDNVRAHFKNRFALDFDVPGGAAFLGGIAGFATELGRLSPIGAGAEFIGGVFARKARGMTLGQAIKEAFAGTVAGQVTAKAAGAVEIAAAQQRTVPQMLAQQEVTDVITTAQADAKSLIDSGKPELVELGNSFLNDEMTIDEFYARFPAGFGSATEAPAGT